jgi:hypothetical protein
MQEAQLTKRRSLFICMFKSLASTQVITTEAIITIAINKCLTLPIRAFMSVSRDMRSEAILVCYAIQSYTDTHINEGHTS